MEAVRCAIGIQQGLAQRNADVPVSRQVRLRIGINIGDVVGDGSDLLGDGVNIAARLESLADTGGIYISRPVRDAVRDHLDLDLNDLGEVRVKNINRPVRVFRVEGRTGKPGVPRKQGQRRRRLVFGALVLLILIGSVSGWWFGRADFEPADPQHLAYALPPKPSIAVLPFENLSADPTQKYLADGLGEDVLTSLSRLSGLFVISSSTTAKIGGKEYTAKRIAEELGVRYILRGSLQRQDNSIRVNTQLLDAIEGRYIWSDRYDREITDLFKVKDEITLQIVSNVGAQLELGERDRIRSRETASLDAWLLQREGYRTVQNFNAEDNMIGRRLLEQAIEIDPAFATAYANLALSYRLDYQFRWAKDREAALQKAFVLLQKALDINPQHGPAMASLASWYLVRGDADSAVETARRAVSLEPSDYFVHAIYGWALIHAGSAEHAVDELQLALRLSPNSPDWVIFKLAEAWLAQDNATEAAGIADGLLQRPPSSAGNRNLTLIIQALALQALGQTEAAREAASAAAESFPKRTVAVWGAQRPYANKTLQARWAETLRELGMP